MTQTIEISSEVLTQEVGGETVILDLKTESYFGLNEVGTRIVPLEVPNYYQDEMMLSSVLLYSRAEEVEEQPEHRAEQETRQHLPHHGDQPAPATLQPW